MATTEIQTHKNYSIEFLRIVFALLIVNFHIVRSHIFSYAHWTNSMHMYFNVSDAFLFVDAFFIIAGFFLYNTVQHSRDMSVLNFAWRKVIRLWSPLALCILATVIFALCDVTNMPNPFQLFLNLMFLQANGLSMSPDQLGITWFVSPFFWGIIFLFYIFKNFDKRCAYLATSLMVYFGYVIVTNYGFNQFDTLYYFLNMAMIRTVAGLGAGYLLATVYHKIKDNNIFTNPKYNVINFLAFSVLEIVTFGVIIYRLNFAKIDFNNLFVFIPLFILLIFAFVMQRGILSKLTNKKFFGFLGKFAYSTYVMQNVSFWLLELTLWQCTDFINHNQVATLLLSAAFALGIGMITYYLVERPALNLLHRK